MNDLIAFAKACLDEDEAAANAVDMTPQPPVIGDTEPRPARWYSMREWYAPEDGYPAHRHDKERSALADLFDRARVLGEVAAKRAIVDECALLLTVGTAFPDEAGPAAAETILRLLVAVWKDRPGYLPEWAPAGEPGGA